MGNLIKIKPNDPAYDKAFKHGAIFALVLSAFMALASHSDTLAFSSAACALAMVVV